MYIYILADEISHYLSRQLRPLPLFGHFLESTKPSHRLVRRERGREEGGRRERGEKEGEGGGREGGRGGRRGRGGSERDMKRCEGGMEERWGELGEMGVASTRHLLSRANIYSLSRLSFPPYPPSHFFVCGCRGEPGIRATDHHLHYLYTPYM